MVRAGHRSGMASVNQTRPHCVNQMGKTHSKPLAARHGRGTAWAQHAVSESALRMLFIVPLVRDTRIWSNDDVIIYQGEQKYSEINCSIGGLADRSSGSTTHGWIERLPRLTASC
jgi:hypothetical protein